MEARIVRASHSTTESIVYPCCPVRGRSDVIRLHHKERETVSIQYVDVMSLYPYLCKYFKSPDSHPVIHVSDAYIDKEPCLRMDGLSECSIVPPQMLYHPVFPYRCNNKLMFYLRS